MSSIKACLLCAMGFTSGAFGAEGLNDPSVYVPDFVPYPGYVGSLHVHGTVTIAGTSGRHRLTWSLTGLDTSCAAGAANGVKFGCGIQVHTGTTCEHADHVGEDFYYPALGFDPWEQVSYIAAGDGSSVQHAGMQLVTGLSNKEMIGRIMVIDELVSGRRIACGVIGTETGVGALVHVASFVPYPGYSGNLRVAGTVSIAAVSGTDVTAKQRLTWRLKGLDTACTVGAADKVKNGCGIHVHTGTSCEVASEVGGHFYSNALASDPWLPVVYVAKPDGSSVRSTSVDIVTGLSNGDIMGRVVVVHELASGARIACGRIQADDQICAGYGAMQPNTDISGVLLAKVNAQSGIDCCALCSDRAECEGYVFHLDQCYLKKDLGSRSFKQDAIARVKATCAAYAPPMVGVDMSGTLLAKVQASDITKCCALCDSFSGCEGYVFHLDQCYLKKDLSSPAGKPGATTRLKYGAPKNDGTKPADESSSIAQAKLRGSVVTP